MTNLIKLPKRFIQDHAERDLDTPEIIKVTSKHFWVRADDPHLSELYQDAEYYAEPWIDAAPGDGLWGIVLSARATKRALDKAAADEVHDGIWSKLNAS
tara:strand:+ start:403 stop:699 length:297 start_codon:yes stop_codon:yes gene_type:complete